MARETLPVALNSFPGTGAAPCNNPTCRAFHFDGAHRRRRMMRPAERAAVAAVALIAALVVTLLP